MKIFTLGFTQKKAETFFNHLRAAQVQTLYDVRLNNVSQLAGFAKRDDLRFFLKELCDIDYVHIPELAPTQDILKGYKTGLMDWPEYEQRFNDLLVQRQVERLFEPHMFEHGCLLCSEHEPHQCHRRLVAEYLSNHWDCNIEVEHLY